MHDDSYRIYLEEVRLTRPCSEEEAGQLLARMRDGDPTAKERLLEGMLQFTLELAGEYQGQGVPMGDLIQEANLALLIAAGEYEYGDFYAQVREKGRAMLEAALQEQSRQQEAQEELLARINVLQKVSKILAEELEREPTVAELAQKMKMTEEEIRMIMKETLNAMSVSPDAEI